MKKALDPYLFFSLSKGGIYITYQRIVLQKCEVVLTQSELNSLLLKDVELFKLGLARSKAFQRTDSKRDHYQKKWATHEEQELNKYIQ